jgi:hypothetical protein
MKDCEGTLCPKYRSQVKFNIATYFKNDIASIYEIIIMHTQAVIKTIARSLFPSVTVINVMDKLLYLGFLLFFLIGISFSPILSPEFYIDCLSATDCPIEFKIHFN